MPCARYPAASAETIVYLAPSSRFLVLWTLPTYGIQEIPRPYGISELDNYFRPDVLALYFVGKLLCLLANFYCY